MKNAAAIVATVSLALCPAGTSGLSRPENAVQDVEAPERRAPNIVLILADDLGWSDVGYNGSRFYETPNIDALARGGIRFTSFYAAAPVCSPTRASIMTGKAPARLGITAADGHLPPLTGPGPHFENYPATARFRYPAGKRFLEPDEYTLAEALRDGGYATAHIGKWHLGVRPEHWPEEQGFDVSFHGAPDPGPADSYFAPYRFRAGTVTDGHEGEYITDRITAEAIEFMRVNRNRPFFLYLPQYAIHAPWQAKKELVDHYQRKADPSAAQHNPVIAAMIHSLDESVGRISRALDELQIADDTLVVFTSDNGGLLQVPGPSIPDTELDEGIPTQIIESADGRVIGTAVPRIGGLHITSNAPLRGGKGNTYEGGLRVPAIFVWPGVTSPGAACDASALSTDLYRTLLEIAQVEPRDNAGADGTSLVPLLEGAHELERESLYWHFPHEGPSASSVIRAGDLKLINFYGRPDELYDLATDPGESNNLAAVMPERAQALKHELRVWLAQVGGRIPKGDSSYWISNAGRRAMTKMVKAFEWDQWRGFSDCTVDVAQGSLNVISTGYRPILLARMRNQGNLDVRLRLKTTGSMPGGEGWIYWNNPDNPIFSDERRVEFALITDGAYHEYDISLPAQGGITCLRLDLGRSATPICIDWIRLSRPNADEVVHAWEFDEE